MPESPGLGKRLKSARLALGLTLDEAADASGLSVPYLSRLENAQRQPSLPALLTLARVYATAVSVLLGESAAGDEPVVRAKQAEPFQAHGWTYWRAGSPRRGMQALRVRVPPGRARGPARVHPGEEWLYVTAGQLRLTLGDTVRMLAPGDVAHFDSAMPHVMESADEHTPVEFLMVHAAPAMVGLTACLPPATH
ncbi:helix-turn-helix domain-containing protein [Yinghuangia seranimata]|uniref:helix-turn-helix domain-containing protein n=1 Tax=Yinghuangia seranimata TaxID=408067 RepID=UPI00248BDF87|nr:XRE family transcriptional regulator [Yinghuangia seranimata]MDI2127267.1 XRE family transcriptional regulator [Yinghuangia seranimata]MDI2132212.1 XRE family transcriptional regulator [Yinghuangia seranimata]